MTIQDGSVGQLNFVQRHGLWSEEQAACVARIQSDIKQYDLRTIRIAWGDQHGIVRGKNVMARRMSCQCGTTGMETHSG